ncbi:MAG: SDR family NAD(P)-dependent oxidoreductase [Deltaproteobacteria bacterium]|nr:SDR family NAD(P)-dependent oxidoreductase [Deltaproteobacteria bacterium]MBW2448433.1 SDR family NAD(P)-dependent oxidoreductase [Deltaproteobacteria bacterium]
MNVEGKAALITGGGTGVGRATALTLAELGCNVAVNYSRSKDEAEATAAEVEKKGVRCIPIQADVAKDADCRRLVETTVSEFARLDVLVQSAGVTSFIPHPNLDDVKDEDWEKIFAVNVRGKFQCARAAKAPMDAAGAGHIVNVSSVAGIAGVGSSIPYCASKAAANNLTITLARALAPKIQVNAVAPGFITGRWLREGLGDAAYEAVKGAMEAKAPLGKVCDPEDVAAAITSLITGSALVTGQVLPVEGGMLIAG